MISYQPYQFSFNDSEILIVRSLILYNQKSSTIPHVAFQKLLMQLKISSQDLEFVNEYIQPAKKQEYTEQDVLLLFRLIAAFQNKLDLDNISEINQKSFQYLIRLEIVHEDSSIREESEKHEIKKIDNQSERAIKRSVSQHHVYDQQDVVLDYDEHLDHFKQIPNYQDFQMIMTKQQQKLLQTDVQQAINLLNQSQHNFNKILQPNENQFAQINQLINQFPAKVQQLKVLKNDYSNVTKIQKQLTEMNVNIKDIMENEQNKQNQIQESLKQNSQTIMQLQSEQQQLINDLRNMSMMQLEIGIGIGYCVSEDLSRTTTFLDGSLNLQQATKSMM